MTQISTTRSGNFVVPLNNATKKSKWLDQTEVTINTPSGASAVVARVQFEADSEGVWSADYEIQCDLNNEAGASFNLGIANVKFRSVIPCHAVRGTATIFGQAYTNAGNDTITVVNDFSKTWNAVYIKGKATLSEEPTAYTIPANMEGLADCSVYVAPASATSAGTLKYYAEYSHTSNILYLDTAAQAIGLEFTRAGNKVTVTNKTYATGTKINTTKPTVQQSIPVQFRPLTSTVYIPWSVRNNDTFEVGYMSIDTSGAVVFERGTFAAWTGSGTCAIERCSGSYLII
jgi:hypothetical protein